MRLKKSFVTLFASLAISSCAKIEIKDIPIHWDAGSDGAVVTHTVSDLSFDIGKLEWDKKRFGYACISQEDFGWFKSTIEKLCGETKLCTQDQKQKMASFFDRAERTRKRKKF